MKSAFLAFAITACLLMLVSALAGALVDGKQYFEHHFVLGLVTTLFIILSHCVVFTYFMATSKMMSAAVEDASLDAEYTRRAMGFKLRAYRVLMPAIVLALVAAVSGAWATESLGRATVHLTIVLASVAFQLIAYRAEYAAIVHNSQWMDVVFAEHEKAKALTPCEPAAQG